MALPYRRVFISYRRADSKSLTLAIRLRLSQEDDLDVFQDITNIPDGYDFRTYLSEGVSECDVLLVVIGDKWVSIADEQGNRRLDNPDDFVRIEVRTGLERKESCLVLPVLVNGAQPPTETQLPDDLKPLAVLNMRRKVREDDDFETDMQRIIDAIRQFTPGERPSAFRSKGAPHQAAFRQNQAVADFYEALDEGDLSAAEALLGQIARYKASNPTKLLSFNIDDSQAMIDERRLHEQREEEYDALRVMAKRNPRGLDKALHAFWRAFPDYDPDNLQSQAVPPAAPQPAAPSPPQSPSPTPAGRGGGQSAAPQASERLSPLSPRGTSSGRGAGAEGDYLARARAFVGKRNRDWTPAIAKLGELLSGSPLPDMEFCLVPPGTFQMGSNEYAAEKPPHPQTFSAPFWMARYPVTNAQWRAGVQAGAVSKPGNTTWYDDPKLADCPVVYVNWFESQKFAAWLGLRLPTEAEWEYAARGVESWKYPWGDAFDGERVIYYQTPKYGNKRPAPVTLKPEGASWVGAMHLSGNVWEWTLSAYQPYPYLADDGRNITEGNAQRVLRGGSWYYNQDYARAAYRGSNNPNNRANNSGFRVFAVCPPSL